MEDVQDLLLDVLRRLEVTDKELDEARAANPLLSNEDHKKALRSEVDIRDPASTIVQLACTTGCNFRLLTWVLSLLGGATMDTLSNWEEGDVSPAQILFCSVLSSCLLQACPGNAKFLVVICACHAPRSSRGSCIVSNGDALLHSNPPAILHAHIWGPIS